MVATVFGTLLAVCLSVPTLQPLALQLGSWLSLAFLAGGFVVVVYAVWRIVTDPSRSCQGAARVARSRSSRPA